MLHFFGRKLQEMQEVKRDERGFTLIELLVVVIIIGVLAAIAIPTFLAQRERAYEATIESDVRNLAAAATSCSADNGGSYAGVCDVLGTQGGAEDGLRDYGYNQSAAINVVDGDIAGTATAWAITGVDHDNLPAATTGQFSTDGANAGQVILNN